MVKTLNQLAMKTTTILTLAILTFLGAHSQSPWPAQDSEWYMGHNCLSMYDFVHYRVTGTEMIDGVEATIIHRADSGMIVTGNDIDLVSAEQTYYVYFDGDTLFHRFQDAFYPLLIFSAQPEDTWFPLPIEGSDGTCNPAPMRVMQIGTATYNGVDYRQITIEATATPGEDSPFFHWEGTFDERTFGRGQLFPIYNSCEDPQDFYCYEFRCYSDADIEIQEGDLPCNYPLNTLGTTDAGYDADFAIWPNPATDRLNIRYHQKADFAIFDMTGRVLHRGTLHHGDQAVEVDDWAAGTYVIKIESASGTVAKKFAVD